MEEELLGVLAAICGEEAVREQPDLELYETGLLDSIVLVEFLNALEERYNLEIFPTELRRAEMDTPRKLVGLVLRRMEERQKKL